MGQEASGAARLPPPVRVIAEVGVNHDGDVDRAHELIDTAALVGADVVKFQTFDPALVVAADGAAADYQLQRTGHRSQRELLESLVLPVGAWPSLQQHATDVGLRFMSTAFDAPSLELLLGLGVDALKIPSGELTNLPFIGACAASGLPLIISTGMGSMTEVERAVAEAGEKSQVTVLHCVTAYPAPLEQANLRAIQTLAIELQVPVGWSDHTVGSLSAVIAVALGAAVLEKHLTYDRKAAGPDHQASEDAAGFAAYVQAVRATEAALGTGRKAPVPSELPNMRAARRSYFATRDLPAGHVVREGDVALLRPEIGMSPTHGSPYGRALRHARRSGAPIQIGDLA